MRILLSSLPIPHPPSDRLRVHKRPSLEEALEEWEAPAARHDGALLQLAEELRRRALRGAMLEVEDYMYPKNRSSANVSHIFRRARSNKTKTTIESAVPTAAHSTAIP